MSLAIFAASLQFFKVFPDFEEDVINAIYDLCKDQDHHAPQFHPIKDSEAGVNPFCFRFGYRAIVQMSKEQPRWVERNVDVLVQLLRGSESLSNSDGDVSTVIGQRYR